MRSHLPFISCRTEKFPDLQEAFLREIRIQTIFKKNHFQRGNRFLQISEIPDFARSLSCGSPREQAVSADGLSLAFHFLQNRKFPGFARSPSSRDKNSNYLQEESLPARQSLLANFRNTGFCKKPFLRGARREGRSRAGCYGGIRGEARSRGCLGGAPREQAVSAGALSLAFHFLQNRKILGFARSLSSRDKNSNYLQEESLPARQSLLANFRNSEFCKKSFLRGARGEGRSRAGCYGGIRGEARSRGCLGGAPREQAVSAGALSSIVYGAMPTGMETTLKLSVADTWLLTGVIFGSNTFRIGEKVSINLNGNHILLFDRQSGRRISEGRLEFVGKGSDVR